MDTPHKWKIEDSNNNSISFTALSKTKAVEQYKRMFPAGRVKKVTDEGDARIPRKEKVPLPGVPNPDAFKPVEPIKTNKADPGPNEPCSCGSGRKWKKCCMRKQKASAKARR
jgi:hypothetical protein